MAFVLSVCLILAGCSSPAGSGDGKADPVEGGTNRSASQDRGSIPAKERQEITVWRTDDDQELRVLGALYGGALAHSGFDVSYEYEFSEAVDVYPYYAPVEGPPDVEPGYEALRSAEDVPVNLALVTTRELAGRHGLEDTADLALVPDPGVWSELGYGEALEPFRERVGEVNPPDSAFSTPVDEDGSGSRFVLGYRALREGRTDAVLGYTTDPPLADGDLLVLTDKENLVDEELLDIADSYPASFVSQEYRESHPEAAEHAVDVLNTVSERLTLEDVRALNGVAMDEDAGANALEEAVDRYYEENPLPER